MEKLRQREGTGFIKLYRTEPKYNFNFPDSLLCPKIATFLTVCTTHIVQTVLYFIIPKPTASSARGQWGWAARYLRSTSQETSVHSLFLCFPIVMAPQDERISPDNRNAPGKWGKRLANKRWGEVRWTYKNFTDIYIFLTGWKNVFISKGLRISKLENQWTKKQLDDIAHNFLHETKILKSWFHCTDSARGGLVAGRTKPGRHHGRDWFVNHHMQRKYICHFQEKSRRGAMNFPCIYKIVSSFRCCTAAGREQEALCRVYILVVEKDVRNWFCFVFLSNW